jgi:hypothetical protein
MPDRAQDQNPLAGTLIARNSLARENPEGVRFAAAASAIPHGVSVRKTCIGKVESGSPPFAVTSHVSCM